MFPCCKSLSTGLRLATRMSARPHAGKRGPSFPLTIRVRNTTHQATMATFRPYQIMAPTTGGKTISGYNISGTMGGLGK